MGQLVTDFPLFPLGLVALPGELVPLHIFEERYRAMVARVESDDSEFGIVWAADDGLKPVGCACEVAEVLERFDDGRINLVARGTRAFRIEAEGAPMPYPTGVVELLEDAEEEVDEQARADAHEVYAELVREATDKELAPEELESMGAYAMAVTVDFGRDAKQGLLDLRSETARLKLVTRLLRAALKRFDHVSKAEVRARSNGVVRFS